jgi:hypothetical protein
MRMNHLYKKVKNKINSNKIIMMMSKINQRINHNLIINMNNNNNNIMIKINKINIIMK